MEDTETYLGIRETEEITEFMMKLFKNWDRRDNCEWPCNWSLIFRQEVQYIVFVIREAMGNRSESGKYVPTCLINEEN